jgi:hypothetical protein
MREAVVVAALLVSRGMIPAQDPADSTRAANLATVKRHLSDALQNQPDYTCLATFDRYRRLANEPAESKVDRMRVEVAFAGNRELYSWPGESKFSDAPLTGIVAQGLVGDGTFAAQAQNLFVADIGVEKYTGDGRWTFQIPSAQNNWTVQESEAGKDHEQAVGSDGAFWIDLRTLDLVRIETHATGLQAGFPLQSVATSVDYARVRIAEIDVLLPIRAEMTTISRKGELHRNLVEYSNCRQFTGQSTIAFDVPPGTVGATPETAKIVEQQLPAGLSLQIQLTRELNIGQVIVGDVVEGILHADLRDGKILIAPKGAAVRGRVRAIERSSFPGTAKVKPIDFVDIGLAFDELSFAGHVYHFQSKLTRLDTTVRGVMVPPQAEGSATFSIESPTASLPKGTLMTWASIR